MEKSNSDPLTVEQFAKRMQVSRTTVFAWIKNGSLKEGVHYIRLGRILRFCWQEGLFFNSQQKPVSEDEAFSTPLPLLRSEEDFQRGGATVHSKPLPFQRDAAPVINLDY